ncbi:MAG: type II secretion system F family protein [Rhodocyclaceae bacterium]|nr:type II secretion system F family protein [Rhodocyclaceae bacterium]
MDYLFYIFITLAFLAVVLFLEGAYLAWNAYKGPEAMRIERRLRALSAGWGGGTNATLIKRRLLSDVPAIERILLEVPRVRALDRLLLQSGLPLKVAGFFGYTLLTAAAGVGVLLFLGASALMMVVAGAIGATVPFFLVLRAKYKRLRKIEQQLPDALDLMSRALRAGHAFTGALQMVATEGAEPVAGEFRLTFDEINYGIAVQDALMNLATRIPSTDLRYFVIAVLIQRDSGGNLAELLDNISRLIRDRLKLLGAIRVLSAEGRLSAWILSCLPFALAAVIHLVNPDFLSLLWKDPAGINLVSGALVLMVIGVFAMWRIIRIRI